MLVQYTEIGDDSALPNPFQFIIHYTSFIRYYISSSSDAALNSHE
jgi:hypothetical protein